MYSFLASTSKLNKIFPSFHLYPPIPLYNNLSIVGSTRVQVCKMGMIMSFMGKGLPMPSTQMPSYVMGSLYKQFVDKNIKTFDEFHVAVLEIFNAFNSSLPGKHYDVPSRKDVEAGYNDWRAAPELEKKEMFINFMKEKLNTGKLDDSTFIIGLATPPAAMAAKRAGENVPQLGFIKAIPDVIFVPSATILALVSAKLTKRMLQGSPIAS